MKSGASSASATAHKHKDKHKGGPQDKHPGKGRDSKGKHGD